MIIDTIENIDFYKELKIYNILRYIKNTNFEQQKDGKYELDGENLFYSISSFNTKPFEDCIWESHYRYTDIQYMVMGEEIIALENINKLTIKEEKPERDLKIYSNQVINPFVFKQNMFSVFFKHDGHMPNLMIKEPKAVRKIVFKVDLDKFKF
jgi:biofilm protein TabA